MTAAAKEYGGALFDLAREEDLLDRVYDDMQTVAALFEQNPAYRHLLEDPALHKAERLDLLDQAFREGVHPYVLNFLKLLCEHGGLGEVPGCLTRYRELLYEVRGILPVTAVTAAPLTDAQKQALCGRLQAMTGKTVQLDCRIDTAVLGGVRLHYAGRELDGTVQGQLTRLRELLTT